MATDQKLVHAKCSCQGCCWLLNCECSLSASSPFWNDVTPSGISKELGLFHILEPQTQASTIQKPSTRQRMFHREHLSLEGPSHISERNSQELSKATISTSGCHGKPLGQNGDSKEGPPLAPRSLGKVLSRKGPFFHRHPWSDSVCKWCMCGFMIIDMLNRANIPSLSSRMQWH